MFTDIGKLPANEVNRGEIGRDVCLGFCYDPFAALGLVYENYHCRIGEDGRTICPSR